MTRYHVFNRAGQIIGHVTQPSGDLANQAAAEQFPTESGLRVLADLQHQYDQRARNAYAHLTRVATDLVRRS